MLLTKKKKKKITNLYNKASCKLLTFNFNSKLNHFGRVENFLETAVQKYTNAITSLKHQYKMPLNYQSKYNVEPDVKGRDCEMTKHQAVCIEAARRVLEAKWYQSTEEEKQGAVGLSCKTSCCLQDYNSVPLSAASHGVYTEHESRRMNQ